MAASEQDSIWGHTHWDLRLYQSELSQTIDDSFGVPPMTITKAEIPISETYLATEIRGLLQNQWPVIGGKRKAVISCELMQFTLQKALGLQSGRPVRLLI